jgi:hypothetical protein
MPVALAPADVTLQKRGGRSHPLGSRTRPGMRQRPAGGVTDLLYPLISPVMSALTVSG